METMREIEAHFEKRLKRDQPDVFRDSFPEQIAFARDPARLKVAFCTRRGAKSFTFGLECIEDSKDWPKANYLFLGLVREEAKRIFWKDVLKVIDEKYDLGMSFNETSLTATLKNGATIYIGAADANEKEMRKLLGQKYRKIAIDEAQDWHHTNLNSLVFHTLKAATADMRGSIELLGTPGILNHGLWDEVTPASVEAGKRGELPATAKGWSIHCWDTSANTCVVDGSSCETPGCTHTMREHWAQEINDLVTKMGPLVLETPWFRRNYKGEKVVEDDARVYRYSPARNDFSGVLPRVESIGFGRMWHYVLGVDLGYNDPSAFVLMAYHDDDPCLYFLEVQKEKKLDITAVATRIKAYRALYTIECVVIDGANKQAVVEMCNRHSLDLVPTEKQGKSDFIELMNADFITGRIKLSPKCQPLKDEYSQLVWDVKKLAGGKREENAACENHAADGGLYGWRWCYQYLFKERDKQPEKGSQQWAEQEQRAMFEKARLDVEKQKRNMGGGAAEDWGVETMDLGGGIEWG